MPSPADADSLRTILLIVLGVMILTIPVVFVIVLSRIMAQRKQRPSGLRSSAGASHSHDQGGAGPAMAAMGATHFASGVASGEAEPSQDARPPDLPQGAEQDYPHIPHHGACQDHPHPAVEPAVPSDHTSPSWGSDSSGMDSGGGSFDSGSGGGGGGDSGGGGGGGSD